MNIFAGVDQGQGAWRSWIKITTMSASEIRERMGKDDDFNPKTSYITSQVAHITCKKDNHNIISNTVSYWCPFCLLSHPEWQESASNTGETRTAAFLEETYEKIKKDTGNNL
jgi:hypothetical protein